MNKNGKKSHENSYLYHLIFPFCLYKGLVALCLTSCMPVLWYEQRRSVRRYLGLMDGITSPFTRNGSEVSFHFRPETADAEQLIEISNNSKKQNRLKMIISFSSSYQATHDQKISLQSIAILIYSPLS